MKVTLNGSYIGNNLTLQFLTTNGRMLLFPLPNRSIVIICWIQRNLFYTNVCTHKPCRDKLKNIHKSHCAILLLRGVQLWPYVVMICHQSQERHEFIPLKPSSIILIPSAEDATRCHISNRLNGVIRSKSGYNNRSAAREISEDT